MTTIRTAKGSRTPYLTSTTLNTNGIGHGFFTRHGGVSPEPWTSLNVTFGLGDAEDNVLENRRRLKDSMGFEHLISARQVHGSEVLAINSLPGEDREMAGYDGLVTNISGVGLMVQQADCQAVLLADPVHRAIGVAHVGWRGSVAKIIEKTVAAMVKEYGTKPAHLRAAISPSLGPCCAEFINYLAELPIALHDYQAKPNYFDFWAISRKQLQNAGVPPGNISSANVCTVCNNAYFSYRRDSITGRGASVIGIRS